MFEKALCVSLWPRNLSQRLFSKVIVSWSSALNAGGLFNQQLQALKRVFRSTPWNGRNGGASVSERHVGHCGSGGLKGPFGPRHWAVCP